MVLRFWFKIYKLVMWCKPSYLPARQTIWTTLCLADAVWSLLIAIESCADYHIHHVAPLQIHILILKMTCFAPSAALRSVISDRHCLRFSDLPRGCLLLSGSGWSYLAWSRAYCLFVSRLRRPRSKMRMMMIWTHCWQIEDWVIIRHHEHDIPVLQPLKGSTTRVPYFMCAYE